MNTVQVDILNPKAEKLLQNLAELNLINIRNVSKDDFMQLLKKFRAKAKDNPISVEEISKEVDTVRAARHAKSKR